MTPGQLNVILLEAESYGHEPIVKFLKDMLDPFAPAVAVQGMSASDARLEGKHSVFKKSAVDVVVCDLTLGHSEGLNGLSIIQQLKRNHPDVVVIAISRKTLTYTVAAGRIPSFDLFIDKKKLFDQRYQAYLQERLGPLLRRNVRVLLDEEASEISEDLRRPAARAELERILRAITFSGYQVPEEVAVSRVVLKPQDGGLSRADTYRMYSYTGSGTQCINAILKVADPRTIEREASNYLKFVKWYLPYSWRPELIGSSATGTVVFPLRQDTSSRENYPS